MEWTTAAKEELDRHLDGARAGLEGSGADPAEVVEDLRRHVQEEARAAKLAVVTDLDVRRILARLGPVTPDAGEKAPSVSKALTFWAMLGSILAVLALVVEAATHTCAGMFIDPIPTVWHFLLISTVPAGTMLALRAARRPRQPPPWTQVLAAFSLGIALYYSALFLPFLPIAAIGVLLLGLGFLPMAPMFSAAGALAAYFALSRREPDRGRRLLLLGLGIAFVIFAAVEAPQTLTRTGLAWSAGDDAAKAARGTELLRRFGSEDILRRACYLRAGRASDLITMLFAGDPVSPEKARQVYYRVYGAAFNSVPAPKRVDRGGDDDWDNNWDPEQGGEIVGNRVRNLALASSRLDGSIDASAAVGYVEWTMVFKNASPVQHEARALVALPPGGVVSRLTLWIDGEEREAAFGGRSQVKQAYEAVVRQRRDPVLVTTRGPDRVIVQLFPVPPNGEMKVRLGITAPAVPLSSDRWVLQLPSIGERNFGVAGLSHSVWIESKEPLVSSTLKAEAAPGGASALRGAVSNDELSAGYAVRLTAPPSETATGADPLGGSVRQKILKGGAGVPVFLVVDGSAAMAQSLPGLAAVLRDSLVEATFAAGDDGVLTWSGSETAGKLSSLKARGGQDNTPALVRAWDAAAAKGGTVVWVHGPLPVALSSSEELRQRWERRPDGPRIHELAVGGGANAVVEGLDGLSRLRQVPRLGAIDEDLRLLLDRFGGRHPSVEVKREHSAVTAAKGSGHLARLWALDEVGRLLTTGKPEDRSKAVALSVGHRLVTPVSGAVVLENAQQYAAAGLTAPDGTKGPAVPVIPEPETWVMLILSALIMIWWMKNKRPLPA